MPPQLRRKKIPPPVKPKANVDTRRPAAPPAAASGAPPQEAEEPPKPSLLSMLLVIPIVGIVAALSITTHFYQRAIEPIYGSIATGEHTSKFIWAASILGILGPVPPMWPSVGVAGALIAALPITSYWVAVYTARLGDPVIGSLLTHLLVLLPAVYLGVSVVKRIVISFEGDRNDGSVVRFTILPASASTITGFQPLWETLPFFANKVMTGSQVLYALGAAAVAVAAVSVPFREEGVTFSLGPRVILPGLLVPLLPLGYGYMQYPILPYSVPVPFVRPDFPLRILSSTISTTGLIVVGETLTPGAWTPGTPEPYPYSLRYLRAGHSLLGGVWIGDKVTARTQNAAPQVDKFGTPFGDSIYSAFILQEAARLVETTGRGIVKGKEEALFIGLGAGIAATAFHRHNIATTVIEIDPAVYNASRDFFGLPDLDSDRVILEDARRVVYKKAREAETTKYDYVVHDCFSGGSVPEHLYTVQFWEDLKVIMNPEGIVAVNFAGKLGSDPSRAILLTLQKSFGQCRAFHDAIHDLTDEELLTDFINIVFFCSPSMAPINFRKPIETDYLSSHLRAHVFDHLPESEVDLRLVRGNLEGQDGEKFILHSENNRLLEWQKPGALEHWKVMRDLLPEEVWITY